MHDLSNEVLVIAKNDGLEGVVTVGSDAVLFGGVGIIACNYWLLTVLVDIF